MRSSITNFIAATLVLLVVVRLAMRYGSQQMGEARYRAAVSDMLTQTRADLDRVAWHLGQWLPEEARRFRRVRKSITDFHLRWQDGVFDEPAMDNTLHNLQDFVERNRLLPQERKTLMEDLDRLLKPKERPKQATRPANPRAEPSAPVPSTP